MHFSRVTLVNCWYNSLTQQRISEFLYDGKVMVIVHIVPRQSKTLSPSIKNVNYRRSKRVFCSKRIPVHDDNKRKK